MNKTILSGHLGSDVEIRYTANKRAVASFRMATNEVYKDKKGERVEKTEWHRIVVWGNQAESCAKYLKKGRGVLLEGKLQTRSWEDKEKVTRYTTEIVAQQVTFLASGQGAGKQPEAPLPETEHDDAQPEMEPPV